MAKLQKSQKSLLAVHMLRIVLELFTSTFLISYILSQNPDSIIGVGLINIGLFYLSWYFVYAILDYFATRLIDKHNRANLLRIGIILNMLLMVALVFWGEQISHWLVLAGALCGMSDGFYYSSYLIMKNELSFKGSFKKYNVAATVGVNLVKVIVPVIMGYVIDASSFSTIAIYVILVCVAQFIVSFFIEASKPKNSSFEIKAFFKYLKEDKFSRDRVKWTYYNSFLAGFKTCYNVMVTVLTIYIFKTNLSLGIFTSIFSLLTMIALIAYRKCDSNPKVNKFVIYMIAGFLPVAALIAMLISTNTITLVILNFTLTIANYFSDYWGSVERDAIMKNLNQYDYIAEHQLFTELIQISGRLITYALILIVGYFANFMALKIFLIFILAINPLKFLVAYKQRLIRKELIERNKQLEQQTEAKQDTQIENNLETQNISNISIESSDAVVH